MQPGEKLLQVTRREVFNGRCGACHGSVSGVKGETVITPDVLAQASRVEANYDPKTDADLPPTTLSLAREERMEVDFAKNIQPILDECAESCHNGAQAPNLAKRDGVLGFTGSYEVLTDPRTIVVDDESIPYRYVDPDSSRARTSYLAEVLVGHDLASPRPYDSDSCQAAKKISLNDLATLMRWMDLGASFLGSPQSEVNPVLPEFPTK